MPEVLTINTARVFLPLLPPSRYKAAWGGRGSGKSHFFAEKLIDDSLAEPGESGEGLRSVCIREVQKDLAQSSKLLIETKLRQLELGESDGFKVFRDVIQTPGDGLMIFKGMNDYTADSIKSLEGFKRAWWEEAQNATRHSLNLLRPTIRVSGSEIWFSWNPRRKTDPVDTMFRGPDKPTGAVVVRANWRDNPWWTKELEQERLDTLRMEPEQYDHIWEGGYATVLDGAYYAKSIVEARKAGRIGRVSADPLMQIRLYCDIGGTGARADAFAMWAAQFIGREIRVLDYYESVGQPLATHLAWCRERGYAPDKAQFYLPHDGETHDKVYAVSYESAIKSAGYKVTVIPNQGKGAAKARVEAGRRMFPSCWFHEEACSPGIDALGWYHEKKDEQRGVGLGPEHDWCFAAGTLVMTPDGWAPIDGLSVHSVVVTPCGNRRIIRSGIARMTDQWTLTRGIRSTPEHRFFTKRGLVTAQNLRSTDELWTHGDLGLSILGSLCAVFRSGFMGAITSATRGVEESERRSSYIGWCTRLFMAEFLTGMKSITSTMTRSITTLKTWKPFRALSIEVSTSQSPGIAAFAEFAGHSSSAIKYGAQGAAKPASVPTTQGLNASAEPAYSLTVDKDECYFVRGSDGRAYLVANSSHGADAFGLMCVSYKPPTDAKLAPIPYRPSGIV